MLSVIVPSFNRANLLPHAVRSIFLQDYRPIEIIIVDDGSTDQTLRVAHELETEGQQYRIPVRVKRQSNKGVSAARNAGLRLAKGQFVQYLDSDDLLHPRKLKIHADLMDQVPQVSYVFSDMVHFDTAPDWKAVPMTGEPVRLDASELYCSFRLLTNVGLYRKSLCDAVGLWNESLQVGEDIEYSLRAMLLCDQVLYLPGGLSSCREHAGERLTDLAKNEGAFTRRLQSLRAMWAAANSVRTGTQRMVGDKLSILFFRLILDAIRDGNGQLATEAVRSCSRLRMSPFRHAKLSVLSVLTLFPHRLSRRIVARIDRRRRI